MDLNMPVMNGRQAVEKMRQLHENGAIDLSKTKIYMHSAIQGTIIWEDIFDGKCMLHHTNFIVNKPVSIKELKSLLLSM